MRIAPHLVQVPIFLDTAILAMISLRGLEA